MQTSKIYTRALATALLLVGVMYFVFSTFGPHMPIDKNVSGRLVVGTEYRAWSAESDTQPPAHSAQPVRSISVTPGIERWYTNPDLNFSFRLPDGFFAPDIITNQKGVYGVRVHDTNGALLTVYAYPVVNGMVLNPKSIRASIPKVTVSNMQARVISNFIPGFEFETDDALWGGAGLVFWTLYTGYRFEIETSVDNRELFNFIVNSWRFAPPSPSS